MSLHVGAVGLGNGLFSSDSGVPPAGISDFMCTGSESRLADCPSVRVLGERCETASAVCQGKIIDNTYGPSFIYSEAIFYDVI